MFATLQKLALGSLRLNSVRFNSQQEVQTNGCLSSKYKYKNGWISFDFDAQRNWSGDVPTMLPKSAFLFCFRANGVQLRAGYIQIKCRNVNIMSVTSFIFFVHFTLTLRLCTVSLPRPRPHFTDVQPTDGDYSDRWCAWSNLVSHLEQKAVCDYWSVLCCFNLFLTEVNFYLSRLFFRWVCFRIKGCERFLP